MISLILFFFNEKFYKLLHDYILDCIWKTSSLLSGGKVVETEQSSLLLLNLLPLEPSEINRQQKREQQSCSSCLRWCLLLASPLLEAALQSPRRCRCCARADCSRWHCHAPWPVSMHLALVGPQPVSARSAAVQIALVASKEVRDWR